MGISYTLLNEVLNGKRQVNAELAMLAEAALGLDADTLVRMQARYNMQVARQDKTFSERLAKIRKLTAMLWKAIYVTRSRYPAPDQNNQLWQWKQNISNIRIAYIQAAEIRPEEFEKRLNSFINKTKENKIITGFGGIDKYYWYKQQL